MHHSLARKAEPMRVSISWHVRVGDDIAFTKEETLLKVYGCIEKIIKDLGKKSVHYVVSRDSLCEEHSFNRMIFCAFKAAVRHNAVFVHNVSEKNALQTMMRTDVLVSTGSSFSLLCAELSPPSQIVLMMPPKEAIRNQGPFVVQTYNRGDAIVVAQDGSIVGEDKFVNLLTKIM